MSKETITLALDELKHIKQWCLSSIGISLVNENVLTALKKALAKQEQSVSVGEPVAWRYTDARGHYRYRGYRTGFDAEYKLLKPEALCLCATPPAAQPAPSTIVRTWVGLTDDEVGNLSDFAYANDEEFVRNVEKHLKEKNT